MSKRNRERRLRVSRAGTNPYPYDPIHHPPHLVAVRDDAILDERCRASLDGWLADCGIAPRPLALAPDDCARLVATARVRSRRAGNAPAVVREALGFFERLRPGPHSVFVCPFIIEELRPWLHRVITGEYPGRIVERDGRHELDYSPETYAASGIEGKQLLVASGQVAAAVTGVLGDAYVVAHMRGVLKALVEGLLFAGVEVPPRWHRIAITGRTDAASGPSHLTRQLLAEADEHDAGEKLLAIARACGFAGIEVSPVPLSGPIDIGRTWVLQLPPELDAHVDDVTLREALDLACMRLLMVLHGLPHPFQREHATWLDEGASRQSH